MSGLAGVSDLVAAGILGLVEGVTEFIPVRSTGHLILAGELLGRTSETLEDVRDRHPARGDPRRGVDLSRAVPRAWRAAWAARRRAGKFILNLLLGFLPAAVVGLAARDFIKAHLFPGNTVAWGLILGAFGILAGRAACARCPRIESAEALPLRTAFGVGLAQVLALYPGISRSGRHDHGRLRARAARGRRRPSSPSSSPCR